MSPIVEVLIPGIPGPPGEAIQVTGPAVIGRESGTGAGGAIAVGAGLSITGGTLTATATDLAYDPATRVLSSSTGADVTLPLATTTAAGLMSAADKALVGEAFRVTIEVRNNTGAEIPAGAACREVGSSGDLPTIALASASDEAGSSKTIGLALAAIPNNSTGKLLALGRLEGINTSSLTEGATVWLGGTPGGLTTTRPTQPAHGVVLGLCIRSGPGGSGILFVRVANGQELNELHDVLITGSAPAAGAPRPVLAWSTDGLWRDVVLGPADVGADATGTAAAAVAAHVAAADPHSQYTTAAEAAAAAPVQSVAGRTGNVALSVADIGDLGTTLAGYVQTSDSRLTDAREWTAATIEQAEAEAGTATTRRAFTAERVRQAVAAWWLAISSSVGRAVVTATDQAAARAAIGAVGGAAGTSGQVQWNNGGAFAGVPSSSVDAGTGAVSLARILATANGAASLPPLSATGTWFTGDTSTTTKPHVLIEPAGTSSTAWSTAGTGWGINAPSGFLGNLFDAQVNGTRAFSVDYLGNITMRNGAVQLTTPDNFSWSVRYGSTHTLGVTSNFVGLAAAASLGWSSNANGWAAQDVTLWRDASDTIGMRRGGNPQSFRFYGTYTNATNYLRGAINATSSQVAIGVERLGSAAANAPLVLFGAGTGTVRLDSPGEIGASSTVATLPASPTVGTFMRVTDALAPAVGSVVAGGGSAQAIVWWDGGNWRVHGGRLPTAGQISGLGTAALLDHGTSPGNAVRLDPTTGKLPAVDGSQLTNLPGGATPAGDATEIQYRNAGALGAIPSSAVDATTGAVTLARLLLTANGAASASPLTLTGTWFTGGTGTNNFPQLLISPTGATLPTFNTAGMGAVFNAPSGFTGELCWLGVNGANTFSVGSTGNTSTSFAWRIGASSVAWVPLTGAIAFGSVGSASGFHIESGLGGGLNSNGFLWWSSSSTNGAYSLRDLVLARDAAGALALRNGTNAQTLRVYDTFASSTDFHRIAISTARATLTNVSGASVTATGLIPAGAVILGVTSKVTTALGTGNGTTGYKIGTAADDDRWGNITGTAAGTTSDNRDWTSGTVECFPAATNVIVTANGGNFNGTGVIYLSVQFMAGQAN